MACTAFDSSNLERGFHSLFHVTFSSFVHLYVLGRDESLPGILQKRDCLLFSFRKRPFFRTSYFYVNIPSIWLSKHSLILTLVLGFILLHICKDKWHKQWFLNSNIEKAHAELLYKPGNCYRAHCQHKSTPFHRSIGLRTYFRGHGINICENYLIPFNFTLLCLRRCTLILSQSSK